MFRVAQEYEPPTTQLLGIAYGEDEEGEEEEEEEKEGGGGGVSAQQRQDSTSQNMSASSVWARRETDRLALGSPPIRVLLIIRTCPLQAPPPHTRTLSLHGSLKYPSFHLPLQSQHPDPSPKYTREPSFHNPTPPLILRLRPLRQTTHRTSITTAVSSIPSHAPPTHESLPQPPSTPSPSIPKPPHRTAPHRIRVRIIRPQTVLAQPNMLYDPVGRCNDAFKALLLLNQYLTFYIMCLLGVYYKTGKYSKKICQFQL